MMHSSQEKKEFNPGDLIRIKEDESIINGRVVRKVGTVFYLVNIKPENNNWGNYTEGQIKMIHLERMYPGWN